MKNDRIEVGALEVFEWRPVSIYSCEGILEEKRVIEGRLARCRRYLLEPVGASVRGVELLKQQVMVMEEYAKLLGERLSALHDC